MREHLESLLLALAVGSSVAIAAKRWGLPYNVALVLVGMGVVLTDILPSEPLDPALVLLVFLPLLVFEASIEAHAAHLRSAARPILALAVPGVAISLIVTGGIATWILALPFSIALLLGALLAITDTVSVLLAFRSVRVPHRLAAIMEGESLFNDGTALVLVSLCAGVVTQGVFDPTATLRSLSIAIVGGGVIGAAFGAVGAAVLRRTPDHLTAILSSVVLVFATSLLAERFHASPVIAVVVAGLYVGNAARGALEPSRVLALEGFWETSGFLVNVMLFLLAGMQINGRLLVDEAGAIALALLALHGGRAIAVYGSFAFLRVAWGEIVPMRWQHVMLIGNIKGALSMAAVLALPVDLPYRARLVTIVFGVTFVTLVAQALPFKRALGWLGVTLGSRDLDLDRARATLISARRGINELDDLLTTGLVSRKDHATRSAAFQRLIIQAEAALRTKGADADHLAVDSALLVGRKAALKEAARRGLVDSSVAEEQIGELDGELVALSEKGDHG
ncbi:MAG: sodium:proton antiporter [Polyangiaceae bacterium]|nr:sodium:proton antiporter [Polyangiaceae bacterium]